MQLEILINRELNLRLHIFYTDIILHFIQFIQCLIVKGENVKVKNFIVFENYKENENKVTILIQMEKSYMFNEKTFNNYVKEFEKAYENTDGLEMKWLVLNKNSFFNNLIELIVNEKAFLFKST
jgi:hypothetical protein